MSLTDPSDVVERVGGVERDDFAARLAQDEEGDARVDWSGGLDEVFGTGAGIHLHLFIALAEGIHGHGAFLEEPAAVEDVVGHVDVAEGDLGGAEEIHGAAHAVGDAAGEEALVVREFDVRGVGPHLPVECVGGGVGVGAGDDDVTSGDGKLFLDERFGLDRDGAVHPEEVADDKGDLRRSIIEDETAGMELVVDVFGGEGGETADDGFAKGRGDHAGCGTGAEGGRRLLGGERGGDPGRQDEDGGEGSVHGKVERGWQVTPLPDKR